MPTPRKTPSKTRVSMTPSRLPPRRTPRKAATPSKISPNQGGEGIQVAIRMRPLNNNEASRQCIWKVLPKYSSVAQTTSDGKPLAERVTGRTFFTFDKTFGENSSTQDVYDSTAKNIVSSAVSGLNGTIFAYGQTSSGKTYTMQGSGTIAEGSGGKGGGIVHMAATDIFKHIENTPDRMFAVQASFLEIYNEEVRDLLSNDQKTIPIREDPRRGVFVQSEEETVTNFESLLEVLFKGEKSRTFASTAMNERSSRSHTLFRITIESRQKSEDQENETEGPALVSTLNLVDLAGSESVRHTGATGDRQKEGGMINQSLLTLSRVIVALGTPNQMHINFRDSKLTRILQPSLSGNARMAVICCATPSELYLEETRSTLQFASRAKLVKTNARVNEVMDDRSLIRRLQRELAEAKKQTEGGGIVFTTAPDQLKKLEEKAESAGSTARAAEERLRRLQSSILNGGALFGEQSLKLKTRSNAIKPRKRRHSEVVLPHVSPTKVSLSVPSPKTVPRRNKKAKAATKDDLISTIDQLNLVKDALQLKTKYTGTLRAKLDEKARLLQAKETEMVALRCSNDILTSERDDNKNDAVELSASVDSFREELSRSLESHEKEMQGKQVLLENALLKLEKELNDRKNLEDAVDSLQTEKGQIQCEHLLAMEVVRREAEEEKARLISQHNTEAKEALAAAQQKHAAEMQSQRELANLITDDNSAMKTQLAILAAEREEIEKSFKTEIEDELARTEHLERELEASKERQCALSKQLNEAEANALGMSVKLNTTASDLQSLKEQLASITERGETRETEFIDLQTKHAALLEESQNQIVDYAASAKESESKYDALEKRKEEIEEQTAGISSQLEVRSSECVELHEEKRALLSRLSAEADAHATVKEELHAKQGEAVSLGVQNEELLSSNTDLREEINRTKEHSDCLKSAMSAKADELEAVQSELSETNGRVLSLESDTADLQRTIDEKNTSIDNLNQILKELEAENLSLNQAVSTSNDEMQTLLTMLADSQATVETLSKSEGNLSLKLTNFQNQTRLLEAQVNEYKRDLEQAQSQQAELRNNFGQTKELLSSKMHSYDDQLQDKEILIDELQIAETMLRREKLDLVTKLSESSIRNEALAVVVQHAGKEIEELNSTVEALQAAIRRHSSQTEDVNFQLASVENDKLALKRNIVVLRDDNRLKSKQLMGLLLTLQHASASFESGIDGLETEIKHARDGAAEQSNCFSSELSSREAEIASLNQQLQSTQDRLRDLERALDDEMSINTTLANELKSSKVDVTNLLSELETVAKSNEDSSQRLQQLENTCLAIQNSEQEKVREITKLSSALKTSSDEKDQKSRRIVEMAEAVTTLEAKLVATENVVQSLRPKPLRELILLFSEHPLSSVVASQLERARLILRSAGVEAVEVDGAEEANKELTRKLLQLSGLGPCYPQLFLRDNSATQFWGDWNRLETLNKDHSLEKELKSCMLWKSTDDLQNDLRSATATISELEHAAKVADAEIKDKVDELITTHDMLEAAEEKLSKAKQALHNLEDEVESKELMLSQSAAAREDEHQATAQKLHIQEELIRALEEKIRNAETAVDCDIEKRNKELNELLVSSNSTLEDYRETIADLRTQLEDTQLRLAQSLQARQEAQARNDTVASPAEYDVEILIQENEKLRCCLEDERNSRSSFEEEQKHLRGEEQRVLIREAEAAMEKLRRENLEMQESITRCENEAYAARQCNEELRDEMKEKLDEIIQIESKVAAYENENCRLKRAARRQDSELDMEKVSLNLEVDKLKSALMESKRNPERLKRVHEEKEAIAAELKSVMATMSKLDVPSLENKIRQQESELSRLEAKLQKKEVIDGTEVRSLRDQLGTLEKESKAKDDRIKKLTKVKLTREQVAVMKKMKADNIEYKAMMTKAESTIDDLKQRLTTARTTINELRQNVQDSSSDPSELAELRFAYDALDSKVRKYAGYCQRLEEEKAEVTNVLRSSNCLDGKDVPKSVVQVCDKLASLEEECSSLSKSVNQATSFHIENEKLRSHNSSLQSQVHDSKKKADQLLRNEILLSEKLASLQSDHVALQRATQETDQRGESRDAIERLERENLHLMRECKSTKKQLQHTRAELNMLKISSTSTGSDANLNTSDARYESSSSKTRKRERPSTPVQKENASNSRSTAKSTLKKGRTALSSKKERRTPGLGQSFPDTAENTQECKQS